VFAVNLVLRVFDWHLSSETSAKIAAIECGFDQASNEISMSRVVFVLAVLTIFEVEIIIAAYAVISLTFQVSLVTLLFLFGVLEISLAGKFDYDIRDENSTSSWDLFILDLRIHQS